MAEPGTSRLRRRTERLLGGFTAAIFAAALLYCQCLPLHGMFWAAHWTKSFGWPFVAVGRSEYGVYTLPRSGAAPTLNLRHSVYWAGGLANLVFALAVVWGTLWLLAWCRGTRPLQWRLASWFVLVAILALR